jgi:hypothetical protein
MTISYEFLKQQLMKVETDRELDNLGFVGFFTRLQDRVNDESYFERLFVTKSNDGVEIVILHQGNGQIDVIGFFDEFINEKKVFKPELFSHIPFIENKEYQQEIDRNWEYYMNILNPNKGNLEILALHKSNKNM